MPDPKEPPTRVTVTGVAGFIGYHLADRLLRDGLKVLGVDALTEYGGIELKQDRLAQLQRHRGFEFVQLDLADSTNAVSLIAAEGDAPVVHLAAQTGVRYSLQHPSAYIQRNVVAFGNVLEGCRAAGSRHLVFASSSSVYGANERIPYSASAGADHPISLYAASKKANELMAHSYAHLFDLPCTGLRFFTVYGPWGRTDMAPYLFTRAILEGQPIQLFDHGRSKRDFTFIDDVIEGIVRVMRSPPPPDPSWSAAAPDPASSSAPYRIYNIGNSSPVELSEFVDTLERHLRLGAKRVLVPAQPGDVQATYADVAPLERDHGFRPRTSLDEGLRRYVRWFREYYRL